MSAAGLQDVHTNRVEPTPLAVATRLSASASKTSAVSALAAISAAQLAAATAEPLPQVDHFLDELSRIVNCPITTYQREQLTSALVGAIDARITALLAG